MITDDTPEAIQTAQHLVQLSQAAVMPFGPDDFPKYRHITVPEGCKVIDLSEAMEKTQGGPNRKKGTLQLKDLASLIALAVEQACTATGYIYADPDTRTITAVFNDNRADLASWRDHRAQFKAEYTPEFSKWMGHNKKQVSQEEFAEFIEDNFIDLAPADATKLLDVATTIQAKTGINFSSSKRLQDGQVQLAYTETIDAKAGADGTLTIPKEFGLAMRIFKNGGGYMLKARLKYRIAGGAVKFWFELDRPERSVEDAFAGYVAEVREKSGYTVLIGTP
jgi:uncharacterized protein YfdQ (DUF2303 family)